MLINFFYLLKKTDVPVSIKELLVLLEALEKRLAFCNIDDFYLLARLCLVKDEKYFDRYDRAFSAYFKDLENLDDILEALIPEDWLRSEFMKSLSDEEKAKIESLGGLEKLLDTFKERLEEQKERHAGGSKWIGTGGTSSITVTVNVSLETFPQQSEYSIYTSTVSPFIVLALSAKTNVPEASIVPAEAK